MFKALSMTLLLVSPALLAGCVDTCAEGTTVSQVRLDPAVKLTAAATDVAVLYDKGTFSLPDSYYRRAGVVPGKDAAGLDAGTLGRLDISLTRALDVGASVEIVYPDRRTASSCRHVGSDDTYRLLLKVQAADGGYSVSSSETRDVGAI